MGTTPKVLENLGLPKVKVTIHTDTIKKVLKEKHHLNPEDLKQIPQEMNDPIAVIKSSTMQNSYIILTELKEIVDREAKPVIVVLHFNKDRKSLELLNVASVYGKNLEQINRAWTDSGFTLLEQRKRA